MVPTYDQKNKKLTTKKVTTPSMWPYGELVSSCPGSFLIVPVSVFVVLVVIRVVVLEQVKSSGKPLPLPVLQKNHLQGHQNHYQDHENYRQDN